MWPSPDRNIWQRRVAPRRSSGATVRASTEGFVAVVRQPSTELSGLEPDASPLILVLEQIEKPGNLGAMLRTADGAGADAVVVTDVYAAGEKPLPGVTGALVADAARSAGAAVTYVPHRSQLAATVAGILAEGDLLLTLGAGDITGLATELVELRE